ncbi:hypothetical protein LAZ67_22001454 [Cordylochernes scorpioides]|uniref:RNA-directed DNA polymerase n=1 Tax=Cordylochernes scorpioides TaxID=51811 RepID=A0ABY6LRE3_9ARAC|nr:hypothetical protein LAZ67_22001454 [Cordylochernes scorpioides]
MDEKNETQDAEEYTAEGENNPATTSDRVTHRTEIEVQSFDGTYPAAQFFRTYDQKTDWDGLTNTEKVLRLPRYLNNKPLEHFRRLRMETQHYIQVRQTFLDLYPETNEATYAQYFSMKLAGQPNLEEYYRNKTALGLQLGLPQEVILETLTEGLPPSDQRLVRIVPPENLGAWFRLVQRIRGSGAPSPRHPDEHAPPLLGPYAPVRPSPRTVPTRSTPPTDCRFCGGLHWHSECRLRQAPQLPRASGDARAARSAQLAEQRPRAQPHHQASRAQATGITKGAPDQQPTDTGASVNLVSCAIYKNLKNNFPDLNLITKKIVNLQTIDGHVPTIGQITFPLSIHAITQNEVFHVYYWKGMSEDISKTTKACAICQSTKPPRGPTFGELGQLPVATQPFDLVALDTIAGLAKYGNAKAYLHVVVDHFSRYTWTFPSKSTSITTYQQVIKRVLQDGSPKRLLTDRAPAFTSPKFRKFLINRNIHPLLTTSNNPQANGLCERLNATLTGKLRLLHLENPKAAWTKLAKRVTVVYNNTPHSVTGFPPGYLMFGVLPPELTEHINPYPVLTTARRIAHERTQAKHLKDKHAYDQQHKTPHFEPGDLVLVKVYHHPNTGKLAPYFTGPYEILEIISPNVVRINRPNQPLNRNTDTVHVNKLQYYNENIRYIAPPTLIPHPAKPQSRTLPPLFEHLTPDLFTDLSNALEDSAFTRISPNKSALGKKVRAPWKRRSKSAGSLVTLGSSLPKSTVSEDSESSLDGRMRSWKMEACQPQSDSDDLPPSARHHYHRLTSWRHSQTVESDSVNENFLPSSQHRRKRKFKRMAVDMPPTEGGIADINFALQKARRVKSAKPIKIKSTLPPHFNAENKETCYSRKTFIEIDTSQLSGKRKRSMRERSVDCIAYDDGFTFGRRFLVASGPSSWHDENNLMDYANGGDVKSHIINNSPALYQLDLEMN